MRALSVYSVFAPLFGLLFGLLAEPAMAASVKTFSPQGQVQKVRQVRVQFLDAMVPLGKTGAANPFDITCSAKGEGHWRDDRNWVYDFEADLGPGESCTFVLRNGLKNLAGTALDGNNRFQFHTGGPVLLETRPWEGSEIDPQQAFILLPNGQVLDQTLIDNVYCEVESVQERIPVKLVTGKLRDEIVEATFPKKSSKPAKLALLKVVQCQQTLPTGQAMRLVWGKGVETANGMKSTDTRALRFQVRKDLVISFSCERENQNASCSPLSDLSVSLSKPITREAAKQVLLRTSDGKRKADGLDDLKEDEITSLSFKRPFPELSDMTLEVPANMRAADGGPLANQNQFPLKIPTAAYPPLAKFATAPFGILELNADPAMPLTVRNVEATLITRQTSAPGKVAKVKVMQDADIIRWMATLERYHERTIKRGKRDVETRRLSLLAKQPGVENVNLPASSDPAKRPFEVLGIPFQAPGFYVLEVESRMLGKALLGEDAPMYVRTSALVTNLAVHVKTGRENGMVWVTTLDLAKPVAGADVQVSDCQGKLLWHGPTRADGTALLPALPAACEAKSGHGDETAHINGYFVSARKQDDKGRADMAFALSSWNQGLEAYRFNFPVESGNERNVRAHTIFDRPLFRAGETVSMKHILRLENMNGFELAKTAALPKRVAIIHLGSGQKVEMPLQWRDGRAAETVYPLPANAKLGTYQVVLLGDKKNATQTNPAGNDASEAESEMDEGSGDGYYGPGNYPTGTFRVEEFRLPLLTGKIIPPKGVLVAPKELPLNLQLSYLNGGGANGLQVEVSSVLKAADLSFPAYDEFSFRTSEDGVQDDVKVIADKQSVTLDKNGAGKTVIKALPVVQDAREIRTEMTFADPNGEIQTISTSTRVWPSAIALGMAANSWVSVKGKLALRVIALNTEGKPQAGVAVEVAGKLKETISHRKRMVGGFYSYENEHVEKDLGNLCSGKSDQYGLVRCDIKMEQAGNIELIARAKDGDGHPAQAFSSIWATQQGELWFDGENQDRMDVLAEKNHYKPGDTAQFQVRMPFRHATALVTVEREGVIERQVVQLEGSDPTVSVPIKASYGPNVYVSVLAIRGRLREVPWYSFFTWGWKEPINWWHEFRAWKEPTALVDLAKPAFKYGIAEIRVDTSGHQLAVQVTLDKPAYAIRANARAQIQVRLPDGKPAAGAEVALAVVDEALLELQSNKSWEVLDAMVQRRSYGVETATAQMQVVGKRHYGRKGFPAGGGGGKSATRELLDTLLLWQPAIKLDGAGRASVNIALNDALTRFKVVAVAESGTNLFGTGSSSFATTQDLQIIAGLPPLVREGDQFQAMVTLRNTTKRAMQVKLSAKVAGLPDALTEQTLQLPPESASRAEWAVTVPANGSDRGQLQWEILAQEAAGGVRDALKAVQRVTPAVPVTVQQATLVQVDKPLTFNIAQPDNSVPGRGGVVVQLSGQLSGAGLGIRRFFETYPYSCLEQKTSRAIGLQDAAMWQKVANELPGYLDGDGLAYYYPASGERNGNRGSDVLTAYILAITHEAGYPIAPDTQAKMLAGLAGFVEGKITREFWAPKKDLEMRKLAALEALSRYGEARVTMLDSIQIVPNQWPTAAVLNWYAILQRMSTIPDRTRRLAEAEQILRARLNFQGTRMGFAHEADDYWWWMMDHPDANAVRLMLLAMDQAAWRDDLPRLLQGALARQQRASWASTVANAWAVLTLNKFAARFEAEKVSGSTRLATLGPTGGSQTYVWGNTRDPVIPLPWPGGNDPVIQLNHDGKGKPWATLQSTAAVVLKAPTVNGYRIKKTIEALEQKVKGQYSVGDVLRIKLDMEGQTDMTWVVVTDPVPAGATVLGSGLGRDSDIADKGEHKQGVAWLAYEERSFEAYRAYFEFSPKGSFSTSYTVRLNNAGQFNLPQTRVEAMYAPEMFGEVPNVKMSVK